MQVLADAICDMRNRIELFCLQHDFLTHTANAAIDKRIEENRERCKRGESPKLSVAEIDELHAYEDSICLALRDVLVIGANHGKEMLCCNKFIQSIELRHCVEGIDFKPYVFDSLIELESLLVAVKTKQETDGQSQLPQGMKDVLKTFTNMSPDDQLDMRLQLFLEDNPDATVKNMKTHLTIGYDRLIGLPTYKKRNAKESRSAVSLGNAEGVFSSDN